MNYRLLGNSGLRVAEISLGTMTFGEDWGFGAAKEDSRKIYDAYRAAGVNFLDTANVYTNGTSETFLGEFIQEHRQEVVLATKYTMLREERIQTPAAIIARAWCKPWRARCTGSRPITSIFTGSTSGTK